jgi:hypothetical protein
LTASLHHPTSNHDQLSHATSIEIDEVITHAIANMLSGPPRLIPFVFVFLCLCLVWWYLHLPTAGGAIAGWTPGAKPTHAASSAYRGDPLDFSILPKFSDGAPKPPGSNYTFKIVIPKTEKEDISWMAKEIPDAPLVIYEVDKPDAENKIPKNKGREAMVRAREAARTKEGMHC